MSDEHHAPYMKVFVWLGVWTVLEIVIALPDVGVPRGLMILGLGAMAGIKAALVGLYYMHLRYEGKLIWVIIMAPIVLVLFMVAGLVPDAAGYYDAYRLSGSVR